MQINFIEKTAKPRRVPERRGPLLLFFRHTGIMAHEKKQESCGAVLEGSHTVFPRMHKEE